MTTLIHVNRNGVKYSLILGLSLLAGSAQALTITWGG